MASKRKQMATNFENMIKLAELKALSKKSLEKPLTEAETRRMLELGDELNFKSGKKPIIVTKI